MTIHVTARFTARPDTIDALRTLLVALVEPIRNDPGCIRCNLVRNLAAPTELTFIEEWHSQAALDQHLAETFVKAAVAEAEPLLAGALDFRVHAPC